MVALIVGISAPFALRSVQADHPEVTAAAGGGEVGYSVNLFLPQDVTVHTGDTVTWDFPWFEPHTVTFGAPTGDPSMPSNPGVSPVVFDGVTYFSSGLNGGDFGDGTPFSVQFTAPGSYAIFCVIHPFMMSTVTVVDGGDTDTQADLDARANAEYGPALAELKTIADGLAAAPATSTDNADGSTTYDAVVSAATLQGDVMQFFPPSMNIQVGDSVLWSNTTPVPHTVTFNMQEYPGGDPFEVPRTAAEAGFDGTGFTNSGIIGVDWPDGTDFELKFLSPGTYNYLCILHANQGMVGTINVSAAPDPAPPDTGSGLAAGGRGDAGRGIWLLGGVLLVVAGAGSLLVLGRNRLT